MSDHTQNKYWMTYCNIFFVVVNFYFVKKGVLGFSCIAPVSIEILAISSENFMGVF